MAVSLLKTHYLVFDRRTIAWTNTADLSRVKRRAADIVADNFMSFFGCIYDVAVYKRTFYSLSFKAEWNNLCVARLFVEF